MAHTVMLFDTAVTPELKAVAVCIAIGAVA